MTFSEWFLLPDIHNSSPNDPLGVRPARDGRSATVSEGERGGVSDPTDKKAETNPQCVSVIA